MTMLPVRPPPEPSTPGIGEFGPGCSPQHAPASLAAASSVVTRRSPSFLNAGDASIFGTHTDRKWSIEVRPPAFEPLASLPVHGASWPSLQRLGVMKEKFGVLATVFRSVLRR